MKAFISTTGILRHLYPSRLIWEMPTNEKKIFLTFDDGPTPGVTDKLLNILNQFNARATFFCIGKNVEAHPDLFMKIKEAGHSVGNHTWDHMNGKKVEIHDYLVSIQKAQGFIKSDYFRPPYGRIKKSEAAIISEAYKIVMWSVLSGDFITNRSKEDCLKTVLDKVDSGSIVVFHDSIKAADNMLYSVPRMLDFFSAKGFKFLSVDEAQM